MNQTTTLIELRRFLERHGGAPPPWSPGGKVTDALFDRLRAKRDDAVFWDELAALVSRLDAAEFDPRPVGGAEALPGPQVDAMLAELRGSLPENGAAGSSLGDWLGGAVSAPALCGFLLLGSALAVSCSDDGGGGFSVEECIDDKVAEGMPQDEAEVYCELLEILEDADCDTNSYNKLLECLPEMDAGLRVQFLNRLQSMSPSQVCDDLSDIYWYGCSPECYFEGCH